MDKTNHAAAWTAVTAAILGLVAGYALVVTRGVPSAYAGAAQCPFHGEAPLPSA